MAIIKCKMCGGDIELTAEKTFGTCEFCGNTMTLPKIDDEQRAAAFNRGNHFRRIGEFDKALAVYERIVREDDTDAEAHWCCALCRFGIEYVEDPATYEWMPTCHRASFDSFLEDVDYKAAVEYSGGITRRQYLKDGAKIAEVQRGILATSQNAEPYDVFICYKESDANGDRTRDSLMAQDIYYQLMEQGRKVFFARITLEDVAGAQYEPYIFAALNSAKVMIVVGTKAEHLNAVWVKNEWSRFLAMMKKDRNKLLLPCYRDMDPYDMPEQLSVLQSYDMSKIGFIQDLTRGIAKVLDAEKKPEPVRETVVVQPNAPATNIAPLLKRAFMFLEDGDWNRADEFCEQVLNIDPECAQAYLGKLMAELQVRKQDGLRNCEKPFDNKNNCQKVMRFGDSQLKDFLADCTDYIKDRNEKARISGIYISACSKMSRATTEAAYREAGQLFRSIINYQDSAQRASLCETKAEEARVGAERKAEQVRKEAEQRALERKNADTYRRAKQIMESANSELSYRSAAKMFEQIRGYKDADALSHECHERATEIRNNDIYGFAMELLQDSTISNYSDLSRCMKVIHNYKEALKRFETIVDWADSRDQIAFCQNRIAEIEAEHERKVKEDAARAKRNKKIAKITIALVCIAGIFLTVLNFVIIPNNKYNDAVALMNAGKIDEAYNIFQELGEYKDVVEKASNICLTKIKDQLKEVKVGDCITFGAYEQDNNTSNGKEDVEWLLLEVKDGKALVISKYALDFKPYNTSDTNVTWETCTLRNWLNDDFINTAFSAGERALIPTVTVSADKNPSYSTDPGNATKDQVFLLSITEANKYFNSDGARQCEPTDYAVANGARRDRYSGNCWWWLRTPGVSQYCVSHVEDEGDVDNYGTGGEERGVYTYVGGGNDAVRPALWIEIGSE